MPRTARALTGAICCHVLNRGNGKMTVFHEEEDYAALVELLGLESTLRPRGQPRKE